ncbi:MAG: cysteine desulfurase [Polyangiaceae bacterium]|nr:cysteine desulfurase [Polyangiaceae bacterium]
MVQRRAVVYLDWNATTPLCHEAAEAMRRAMVDGWANPASVHREGRRARAFVESAREGVARLAAVDPRDVFLTSGGTEANNLALRAPFVEPGGVLVVSRIEHPSVLRTAQSLASEGTTVVEIEPRSDGSVDPAAFQAAVEAHPGRVRLVSLQALNHETGVLQPVHEVAEIARRAGALFHCDAVQAVGRLSPDVYRGADFVTVASHKLRGPKGVGALATLCGVKLRPLLRGGDQERGVRPGTQDPVACAGFAAALDRAADGPARYETLRPLRDRLEAELAAIALPAGSPIVNGTAPRAPHVANLSFPGWIGPELCAALDLEGVCVSSGSACSAGTADPSPVLTAMLGIARARSAVRASLGEATTERDVVEAVSAFRRVLARSA